MLGYDIYEWILFFFIYCFLGWCIESTIVSFERKKLINRGFLKIPILPIYGTGAIIIILITLPVKQSIIGVYIIGVIGATVLEYFVGLAMECIFKMKYWDYSEDPFNYKGRIALLSSLFWGLLSVILVRYVHRFISGIVLGVDNNIIKYITVGLICITLVDTILSTREAIDLNKVIVIVSEIKNEFEVIHKQTNDVISLIGKSGPKKEFNEKLINLKDKILNIKNSKISVLSRVSVKNMKILKRNPSASSSQFNDILKELKKRVIDNSVDGKNEIIEKVTDIQKKIEKYLKK